MNVAQVLNDVAPRYGDRHVMVFREREVPFPVFHAEVRHWQRRMVDAGVKSGDRVLLMATNKPGWMACYFAVLSLGAVLVPVNPALTAAEVAYIVDDCQPVLAFLDGGLVDKLREARHQPQQVLLPEPAPQGSADVPVAPVSPGALECLAVSKQHPGIIFYTSGTTGRPKGAVLTHGSTWSTQERCGRWMLDVSAEDCALIIGSFAFILHSSIAALSHIAVGARFVIHERFHPQEALDAIARHRVTVVMWVPTMYVMALEWAESREVDLSSLRVCISGGAVLPWAVAERFEQRFGKHLLNGWGMTEGTPITAHQPGTRGRPESIGRVLPGCAVRILDENDAPVADGDVGQLVFSSESNMLEYYNKPEATAETLRDGWVYSGDLGWMDKDGYYYLVGRSKDMIIRGGAKVYPVEVEEVLNSHEDVAGCAVVGKPDGRFGETVVACVKPRDGRRIDKDALLDYCRTRLADYKAPQEVHVVDEFPLGPTGKILKRVLRDQLQHGISTSS